MAEKPVPWINSAFVSLHYSEFPELLSDFLIRGTNNERQQLILRGVRAPGLSFKMCFTISKVNNNFLQRKEREKEHRNESFLCGLLSVEWKISIKLKIAAWWFDINYAHCRMNFSTLEAGGAEM